MNIIWKISLRNLLRHKGKSLVIGAILFLGAVIMTLGNGVINGMTKNIEQNMVQNFSGDIIVVSSNQLEDNVFTGMNIRPMKILSDYRGLESYFTTNEYVEKFLPMNYGMAMLLTEGDHPSVMVYFGVDFKSYQEFFPDNLEIIEGRILETGERGIILNDTFRERIYEDTAVWPVSQDGGMIISNLKGMAYSNKDILQATNSVVVMGISDSGSMKDIRLNYKGIFKYKQLNQLLQELNFMDIESFREAFGLISAADTMVDVSEDNVELLELETDNLDDIFGEESLMDSLDTQSTTLKKGSLKVAENKINTKIDWKDGSFHFISLKLKEGVNRDKYLEELNQIFKDNNMDARGIIWHKALGQIGNFTRNMKFILLGFVTLIYIVAALVIMNTLSMNALERTNEIGMMRAVGAQRSTIGRMFVSETTLLSAIFGGAGIVFGTIIVWIFSSLNLVAPNEMTQMLFGGDYFKPIIDGGALITGIFNLIVVTLLAMIYPVIVAKRITPLEAISRD